MKPLYIYCLMAMLILSCNQKEIKDLKYRVSTLEEQLDDCQNGAEKLLASLKTSYEKQEPSYLVKNIFDELEKRHPESPEYIEAKKIYNSIIEKEDKARKEKERLVAAEKAKRLQALKRLRKDHDDVSGVTWYKQPYFTHYTNTNLTSIYMGQKSSDPWIRLQMTYTGEDWIFFEKAYLSYDGNTKEIVFDRYKDKETDNGSGSVWEWIDLRAEKDLILFLRDFCNSKNAKMRLSGKYTKTRKLTYNERKGIEDVLKGYDALMEDNSNN